MKTGTLLLLILLGSFLTAETADEILVKMENAGEYTTSEMESEMKIVTAKGDETKMRLMSYEKRGDEDFSLMWFTEPARLKGTKILTKGDNIWYYNVRTNRDRLLTKSAKKGSMMGSSFSYDDMDMEYTKDFTAQILEDKKDFYWIKAVPLDEDRKYSYLKIKVRKEDFLPEIVEYYDKTESKYKEMILDEFVTIDDHPTALNIRMEDLSNGKITYMITDPETLKFNSDLNEDLFNEKKLKQ
ncbi:outer membrane lipoprotein-sorting protein [Candidatus Cloacimonadota bacterium]